MNDFSIGRLRSRILLETPVTVADGAGGQSVTWQGIAEIWARIASRSGGERLEAHGQKSTVQFDVLVRFRPDVLPDCRFRVGLRILHIRAVRPGDDRSRRLLCSCEEVNL